MPRPVLAFPSAPLLVLSPRACKPPPGRCTPVPAAFNLLHLTSRLCRMPPITVPAASFATGLTYGGPAVCIWGWLGVSFCMLCIALGMAELSSAYPTSGGMYYWQFRLAGRTSGPFACWLTGACLHKQRKKKQKQKQAAASGVCSARQRAGRRPWFAGKEWNPCLWWTGRDMQRLMWHARFDAGEQIQLHRPLCKTHCRCAVVSCRLAEPARPDCCCVCGGIPVLRLDFHYGKHG